MRSASGEGVRRVCVCKGHLNHELHSADCVSDVVMCLTQCWDSG